MEMLAFFDDWPNDHCRRRRQMARDSNEPVVEKHLFHGTSRRAVDAICMNNFDWRLCGSHGTMYGQGMYENVGLMDTISRLITHVKPCRQNGLSLN
jgi:hypothetical protein